MLLHSTTTERVFYRVSMSDTKIRFVLGRFLFDMYNKVQLFHGNTSINKMTRYASFER